MHIWAYRSLDDRERRRGALMEDPAWRAFLPKIRDLIEVAENKIMKAARFSPTGGSVS
ncbi:NIPSNAP domain-containing protein (plasmid) [Sinorhizobium fredii]|uniref:NIPSNAP domain-containing protein n=1 Tax=Rhizobium fredii TaxID=380 RepID=A0A2L0HEZ4_RHIFR|nr:NIPSNAP domain-containing protein [Sinorhizobium fredii]